jgi:hypothetical protein
MHRLSEFFSLYSYRGLWRLNARLANGSHDDPLLNNMEGSSVNVAVRASGEQGASATSSFDVALAPHQTRIVSLNDRTLPFTARPGPGKLGGISITHSGEPGAVLAYGLVSKPQTGFSSRLTFEDPATSRSRTLAAAHVLLDQPDVPGFSGLSRFTSIALLRNASDMPLHVAPSLSFFYNGSPRTLTLTPRHLLPGQLDAINLGGELRRAGLRGPVSGVGLTLVSTGNPGALIAHLTSYDQTRNHVFDIPLKDPAIQMSRFSGSYPFNLEGNKQGIIHVRNTTGEKARFTIQLDFETGSYTLPIQILDPGQEAAIDIRELRDSQTPDSIRRTIPRELPVARQLGTSRAASRSSGLVISRTPPHRTTRVLYRLYSLLMISYDASRPAGS